MSRPIPRSRLGPALPRMFLQCILPVRRKELDQLPPFRVREARAHTHMLQHTRIIEQPKQQRPDRLSFTFLMPPKSGDHAIAVALVLHLQHHPLVRLVGPGHRLGHNPVKPRAFKPPKPIRSHTRIPRSRSQVKRRRGRRKQRLQFPPPALKRNTAQIPIAHTKQIEEHNRRRNLLRQKLHPRSRGMNPQLQSLKVQPAILGDHNLPIEHAPIRQLRPQRFDQLRKIPVQRFLIPALQQNFIPIPKNQSTKPIPLRLEDPVGPCGSSSMRFESIGKTGGFTGKFIIQCYTAADPHRV